MSVNLMRKIDYWLGIPLCVLMTYGIKLVTLFSVSNQKFQTADNTTNTLVIGLSEMGSMVLAQAALRKLNENSSLFFVTFSNNKPALKLLNLIPENHIFTLNASNVFSFTKDCFLFLFWARKQAIHVTVDLELFSRFSALLNGISGAQKRIGFHSYHMEGLYRGNFMTHPVAYNPHCHISKNFMSLAYAAETPQPKVEQLPLFKKYISDNDVAIVKTEISSAEQDEVLNIIKQYAPNYNGQKIILMNSEGGDLLPMRNWGQDKFYELILLLIKHDKDAYILLTGSKDEKKSIDKLHHRVKHPQCINFSGAVSLPQLLVLYSLSQLMVTNDSGPNHFAALTEMITYTLFGPETPKLYGSLGNTVNISKELACSPCVTAFNHRKTACVDNICMQTISSQEVFQQIISSTSYQ